MALITAIPLAPAAIAVAALDELIPPIAMMGKCVEFTESRMSDNP